MKLLFNYHRADFAFITLLLFGHTACSLSLSHFLLASVALLIIGHGKRKNGVEEGRKTHIQEEESE